MQGKAEYTSSFIRRFDPYVFTFNLETETVSTLIIFPSVLNVSWDLYLSALRGRDDVLMSECISSMISSNANFRFDLELEVVYHLQKKSGNFGWSVNGKTSLVFPNGKFPGKTVPFLER